MNYPARYPSSRLTEADVEVIRQMLSSGRTQGSIGKEFGVSGSAISCIARGRNWPMTANQRDRMRRQRAARRAS